MLGTDPSLVII